MTNQPTHNATPVDRPLSSQSLTWDQETHTWDQEIGTWDNPYAIVNQATHSATPTNINLH